MNDHLFSCRDAKQIDLVDYLASLGLHPRNIRGNDHWYISPFRDEATPSFKVNKRFNIWYDHGEGKGGNLIDFGIRFHQCSISELLKKLSPLFSFQQSIIPRQNVSAQKNCVDDVPYFGQLSAPDDSGKIRVLSTHLITSSALVNYLESRCIDLDIADRYCKEVRYQLHNKVYYAIGFKNDQDGYELRNPRFKGSSSPKEITFLDNGKDSVRVFEGFFSFLSLQTIQHDKPAPLTNFLILNSLAFFEKSRPVMERHGQIHLYLDRDNAGTKAVQKVREYGPKYMDLSDLYTGYKDLNEMLKAQKQHIRHSQRPGRHL